MQDKRETVFILKSEDEEVEVTPYLFDKYLTKRERRIFNRLIVKHDKNKEITKQDRIQIAVLLSKLEIKLLEEMTENKTKRQKEHFEALLTANTRMQKKIDVVSVAKNLRVTLTSLCFLLMLLVMSNHLAIPSVYIFFIIVSLAVNVLVTVFMIYCKEHIWNWKTMNPVIKVIWWIVLLVNMMFAAKTVLELI